MASSHSLRWTTDPEYIDLLNYIIKRTKNVESPMSIQSLARGFKEKSGVPQSVGCLGLRIQKLRTWIQCSEHIDTNTKVKVLFALSGWVHVYFLEEFKKNAFIEVDEKNRIVHYKAIDGSLELGGDHRQSETYRILSKNESLIRNYFENKSNADTVPKNEEKSEMENLIEFITEKCENVNSPLSINRLAKDFIQRFGVSVQLLTIMKRVKVYCREIQTLEFLDTPSKVKQLFGLSATLDSEFLKELRRDAAVEVDNRNRITKYTDNDGRLTLHGDHSLSAKQRTAQNASKGSLRSLINSYFENKNDADAVPKNEEEKEIVKAYCYEIQKPEFIDTPSKVKQLFVLSATLDSDFLKKLRKDAFVEVDHKNRIIEYISNDGSFTLRGSHWGSGKTKPRRMRKKTVEAVVKKSDYEGLDDGSEEYSSEESDSEFDTDDEAGNIEMSIEDDFEFTPKSFKRKTATTGSSSSKRTRLSSNDSMRPNEMDDYDTNYSIDDQVKLEPFRGSIQEDLNKIEGDEDIQQIPEPLQALDEHDQIEEVPIKVEPEELKIVENPTEDVKPEIAQGHDEHKELIEITIKLEHEEPVEVKPETSHNFKTKLFEAMQSLILCLDTPSLSWFQSKIHEKMRGIEGSYEVILNNEINLIIDLLISRMSNDSVVNFSETAESVNFSNFLCYLKASILNSKMSGVEDLVTSISNLIEESQKKRIPMEKVANALRATLNIDGF